MIKGWNQGWSQAIALLWIGHHSSDCFGKAYRILLPIRTSLKYNEGWNAYQAAHAFSAEPLYPGLEATLFPTTIHLLLFTSWADLGKLLGDNIIAGRVIALAAFIGVGTGIGWIVAKRFGQPVLGLFMSLFFLAYVWLLLTATILLLTTLKCWVMLFKWRRWYG